VRLLLTSAGIGPEHRRCAGRPAGQADRRRQGPLHPHGAVRPPHVRASLGLALHHRPDAATHVRPGLEVAGRVPWVREADVLLAAGGDATYLCHWMRESGLADLLPSLQDTVWVGLSAGSMVMTPGSVTTSSTGRRPAGATAPSGSSTSRSSRTWVTCRTTPLLVPRDGRPRSGARRMQSTTRRPSRWPTAGVFLSLDCPAPGRHV
jgi:hypothetical protein